MTPRLSKIWCFFILAGILSSTAGAGNPLEKWRGFGLIESRGDLRYKSLYMDERIYRYVSQDLGDLRITDEKGRFVPYLLQNGHPKINSARISYETQLIRTFRKKNNAIFDYQIIPENANSDIVGNVLHVDFPDRDFYKEVDILGSYDGIRWDSLEHAALYRINGLQKTDIPLTETKKYCFYRIIIVNDLENIELNGLQLLWDNKVTDWADFLRTAELPYVIRNSSKTTRIIIKNSRHLKIKRLNFKIKGNFKREFLVSEGTKNDAVPIADGMIYNLKFKDYQVSNLHIDLSANPSSASKLAVEVKNYDDWPLAVESIQAEYYVDRLIFEGNGSAVYRLYFGNPNARKPFYDMETYRSHIENEKTDLLAVKDITTVTPVKADAGKPWDFRIFFNIVIAAVAVLLVVLLVGKLNRSGEE